MKLTQKVYEVTLSSWHLSSPRQEQSMSYIFLIFYAYNTSYSASFIFNLAFYHGDWPMSVLITVAIYHSCPLKEHIIIHSHFGCTMIYLSSLFNGHLSYFQSFTATNKAAMIISVFLYHSKHTSTGRTLFFFLLKDLFIILELAGRKREHMCTHTSRRGTGKENPKKIPH